MSNLVLYGRATKCHAFPTLDQVLEHLRGFACFFCVKIQSLFGIKAFAKKYSLGQSLSRASQIIILFKRGVAQGSRNIYLKVIHHDITSSANRQEKW